jgi:hypothetical protein
MKDEDSVLASSGSGAAREPKSVRPGEAAIEWRKLKTGAWIGYCGSQVLCIVEKLEDFPVEAWTPHCLRDAFTNPEAAMHAGELLLRSIARDQEPPPSSTDIYLPILKGIVAALEEPLLVGRSQSEVSPDSTEAKTK